MTTTNAELDAVVAAAAAAAPQLATTQAEMRAGWLEAVAAALDERVDELVALADEETHLGPTRLTGEVARTTGQLRLFARVARDGAWFDATIDHADPAATPPSPDLRRMVLPLGPVAVFSASNFPFAFSVAGGDTASALAVGCPVIVKAHPAHARLSRRVAEIVGTTLERAGAPSGTFALVEGVDAGTALVQAPGITAVAFTGSLHGGRALFDLAVGRPDPIPFYGELGSLNPVVVTRDAASARLAELAEGLVGSFTLGTGQFCTKPGIVLVPDDADFGTAVVEALGTPAEGTMLSAGLADAFHDSLADLVAMPGVEVAHGDPSSRQPGSASPIVLTTTAAAVLAEPESILVECFGPTTLLIRYTDVADALAVMSAIGGSLTATLHAEPAEDVSALVDTLSRVAGRVLFGGWPTGVAVIWAQQHGGPWPSTTNPLHTSVGAAAVRRFVRPVAYQSAPAEALPPALRDDNPLGVPQRVDGVLRLS